MIIYTDADEPTNDSEVVFNLPQENDPESTGAALDGDATQMEDECKSRLRNLVQRGHQSVVDSPWYLL